MIKVSKEILKKIYKKRPLDARKYDFGLLLVIGGSDSYSGSPALSAMAAFRSGTDMVNILAPERAADIIASFSPNLSCYPLLGKYLDKEDLATVIQQTKSAEIVSKGKTAVVIGGGTGRSEEIQETILEYISEISVPMVIDADAIHAVAQKKEILEKKEVLLTPHTYEFKVLTGRDLNQEKDKIKAVKEEAEKLKTVILLKGEKDIISDGKEVAVNETGSPYLTVGGTGDVLAGICGGLMARKISLFDSAQAGSFINSQAGKLAADIYGEGLVATDVIKEIPKIIKEC